MAGTVQPVRREIRFAVVMYGGVSLAIYINGIAQELYHLVRSTARKVYATGQPGNNEYLVPEGELDSSEKIYRKLGEQLGAAFVVDILSGTSAGGINAVFLAKALANDQPFKPLKDLWVNEGDINKLLNDKGSGEGLKGLPSPSNQASLLNSQRMYYKLLYAIHQMERLDAKPAVTPERNKDFVSPYVGELDLFVTATDLRGLTLPLMVNGEKLFENRYRTVFRFHYSTEEAAGIKSNDFTLGDNPFLAFAARCTSSFPVAFEPMILEDIKPVLNSSEFGGRYNYNPDNWFHFYKDYAQKRKTFPLRPFGDGGYLDNKPFSYATETLLRRRADLPVDRKLIYIEPAPEHPENDVNTLDDEKDFDKIKKPDAVENTLSALTSLPRKETIREDLRKIDERNTIIRRVNEILQNLSPDMLILLDEKKNKYWEMHGKAWASQFLDYSVNHYGPSYAFYHQLRVTSVIEEMAATLLRNLGWEDHDPQAARLREALNHDWRAKYYATRREDAVPSDGITPKSENNLLYRLDLSFRTRRMQYMQKMIDQMLDALPAPKPGAPGEIVQDAAALKAVKALQEAAHIVLPDISLQQADAVRENLLLIKNRFGRAYRDLRDAGRSLRQRGLSAADSAANPGLQQYIQQVKELAPLFESGATPPAQRGAALEKISLLICDDNGAGPLGEAFSTAGKAYKGVFLEGSISPVETEEEKARRELLNSVRKLVEYHLTRYEYYDMVTFPIVYGTNVGEADEVEVIRISSEDATSLVNEVKENKKKLKGTKVGNFGAFFAEDWRVNDITWGRLDGAECLIKAILPEGPERNQAIADVQQVILEDEILKDGAKPLFKTATDPKAKGVDDQLVNLVKANNNAGLKTYFLNRTLADDLPGEQTAGLAARASQVTGALLKTLSKSRESLSTPASWILTASQVFSVALQAAVPGSLGSYLFHNWLPRLYILALVLLVAGKPLGLGSVSQLGGLLLIILIGLHAGVIALEKFLKGNSLPLNLLKGLGIALVALLVIALLLLAYLGLVQLGVFSEPSGFLKALIELLKHLLGR